MDNIKLYQKLQLIMDESDALEKDQTVGYGNNKYKAVSEASVLNTVKKLLKAHKVIFLPIKVVRNDTKTEFATKNGDSVRLMTDVHVTFKVVDTESGQFELLETSGSGVDTQDKAVGKAMTYAYKILMQKTFMLFSGEDADVEHSDESTTNNTKPKQPKYITDNEANLLAIKATEKKVSMKAILANYKINSLDKMTKEMLAHANKYLDSKEV